VRLLIHAGTHKTASTFFQHVLVLNREALAAHGVYVAPDAKLTANHGTAWMALRDDFRHVAAHVAEARRLGRTSALLSSEDFETLVFDQRRARAVEDAAREAGATTVEWHFCLRDPGEYFSSMYAQLSRLAFVTFAEWAALALRDGRVRVPREAGRLPAYWDFCFDYETHLMAFARAIDGRVVVHDFRDRTPFPAHGIIEAAGAGGTSALSLPGRSSRNVRADASEVPASYAGTLDAILAGAGVEDAARAAVAATLPVGESAQAAVAAAASRKFAPGMERLLAERVLKSS
jgi:hypothetical protein